MKLTYIYHSSFALEAQGFNMLFDYYKDGAQGEKIRALLDDEKKLYVFSSHSHADHFNPEVLKWKKRGESITYLLSSDIADFRAIKSSSIFYLGKNDNYTDANIRLNAFGSTDAGISFLIEAEGKKIFHAGDLNNWHWRDESTPEEIAKAECAYLNEIEGLYFYTDNVDLAMFPVDASMGTDFARGAEQFLDKIKVGYFSPMHFTRLSAGIKKAAEIKRYAESKGARFIDWEKNETLEF